MECYLLSESNVRGYRKHMLSSWLIKGMFWVSKQRLDDQANIICRSSCMTELEIEELKRDLIKETENHSCKEEERIADDTFINLDEEVRELNNLVID